MTDTTMQSLLDVHRTRLARWVMWNAMKLAARLDYAEVPKVPGWNVTFENDRYVLNNEGRGCEVWYPRDAEYHRAWDESRSHPGGPLQPNRAGKQP